MRYGLAMDGTPPSPLRSKLGLGLALSASVALLASGCIRDKKDGGKTPNPATQTRVGNDDPRGVDAQPDWDQQARELAQRVGPRMPDPLPTDKKAACEAMLDEAMAFYMAVETDPERRAERMAELQATREADLEGCIGETSIAAAVCVTILLGDRDSEFPWLLDQCTRAYPSQTGGGPLEGPKARARAESIELTFVGDIIFGRYREDNNFDPIVEPERAAKLAKEDEEPLAGPFAELDAALRSDLLVGNLETPVIEDLPQSSPIGSKYRFGGDREMVRMLKDAGFGVLSLANNHFYDLREDGQLQSPKILAEEGILPIGVSYPEAPVYRVETTTTKGWRVGLMGVTNRINAPVKDEGPQVPYIELREMVETLGPILEQARPKHDLLIVAIHWGDEYEDKPNYYQQKVARELIDLGVDMVVGHHPHVLQGVEAHGDGLIAYSMGNFLFEHTGSIPRLTGVLRARWVGGAEADAKPCLDEVVFHTAFMKRLPYPHPAPANGYMGRQVRDRVTSQAKDLGGEFEEIEGGDDLRLAGLGSCGAEAPAEAEAAAE
jgi:poly-gamma-glutamate synthesis protein (capsule biosynthesis protein)